MTSLFRLLAVAAFALSASASLAFADPDAVTPKGARLVEKLDSMGVESKWIAGAAVDWRSGLPDGESGTMGGRHTHCSAFVAAAASLLGVYILRPPQHGQNLLSNAQFEWLAQQGAADGWRPVANGVEAQSLANQGYLVVASYRSRLANRPGHIAIIKPEARTRAQIESEGPLAIMAGTVNSASISVRQGFAGHPHAWDDDEIKYYAHTVPAS